MFYFCFINIFDIKSEQHKVRILYCVILSNRVKDVYVILLFDDEKVREKTLQLEKV